MKTRTYKKRVNRLNRVCDSCGRYRNCARWRTKFNRAHQLCKKAYSAWNLTGRRTRQGDKLMDQNERRG